jgi:hypothetical protein
MHGGKVPIGVAANNWRFGRYSKHMPAHLLQSFQERASDPNILVLRSEIAVLQTRLGELLDSVHRGERPLWDNVQTRWSALKAAQLAGDNDRAAMLFGQVDQAITAGSSDYAAWREIGETVERIRRAVETETRRESTAQEWVRRAEAGAVLVELGVLIREHWPAGADPRALAAISEGIHRFLSE